ncbi:phospho-sugar mutase [Alistipes sp. OttesenSCG-928-B03]|nr:phospho-sugar mutase [Alistipes sp. OttesenSCG-928-B03]
MNKKIEEAVMSRVASWLEGDYDAATKERIKWLIENDPKELNESFYKGLEFGTGGMRGIMGAGTNRMNIYTVGMATQGLSNYLKQAFPDEEIRVAIAHDCRNHSREFAERVADIFASNGFRVFLFDSLRPTPELSFAIRELSCHSGVVVTASHNPKEYNGYKAYWQDGAQVTAPHDANIIKEVEKITSVGQIETGRNQGNITILDQEFDRVYLDAVKSLSLSPEAVEANRDMKIVYTPLHGSGVILVPAALREFGFNNIHTVREQNIIDGDFPTVVSPNPEERTAMKMALELGGQIGADLILATDPDADRLGIAVPDGEGNYVLLNGNQTCVLLTYYICRRWSELGRIDGRQYVVKTIVTSEMVGRVAESFGAKYYDCLTGFKYIAEIIRNKEGAEQYICGGEESFGFLPCDFVRDKDAVCSCALAAEATAWARSKGISLYQLVKELYVKYGFFREDLVSVVRKGQEGQQEIAAMMEGYRNNPPHEIAGSPVVIVRDYQAETTHNLRTGETRPTGIERSNVLQFLTADDTIVSVRPSGTEPKIKYYIGVREELSCVEQFDRVNQVLADKIEAVKRELELI